MITQLNQIKFIDIIFNCKYDKYILKKKKIVQSFVSQNISQTEQHFKNILTISLLVVISNKTSCQEILYHDDMIGILKANKDETSYD